MLVVLTLVVGFCSLPMQKSIRLGVHSLTLWVCLAGSFCSCVFLGVGKILLHAGLFGSLLFSLLMLSILSGLDLLDIFLLVCMCVSICYVLVSGSMPTTVVGVLLGCIVVVPIIQCLVPCLPV